MNNDFYSSEYNGKENTRVHSEIQSSTINLFIKSYLWMFISLLITFVVGLLSTTFLQKAILSSLNNQSGSLIIFFALTFISTIAQFILCFKINKNALVKANFKKAMIGLIVFAILNGFTFSTLFIYFDVAVLYQVFGVVTVYYLLLTGLSYLFRKKIHKARTFAYIGLISLLIVSIIVSIYSLFSFNGAISSSLYLGVNILGLVVFTILTLVDVHSMYNLIENSYDKKSASVAAAFSLYLDFINIFVYILRLVAILGRNNKK